MKLNDFSFLKKFITIVITIGSLVGMFFAVDSYFISCGELEASETQTIGTIQELRKEIKVDRLWKEWNFYTELIEQTRVLMEKDKNNETLTKRILYLKKKRDEVQLKIEKSNSME